MANPEFDTIKPATVTLTQDDAAVPSAQPARGFDQRLAWAGLAVLALVGLVTISLLPDRDVTIAPASESRDLLAPATRDSRAANKGAPTLESESPYQAAIQARDRRAAQDALSTLIDQQRTIENKAVEQWGSTEYQAGIAIARTGDEHFAEHRYAEALTAYRDASERFTALHERAATLAEEHHVKLEAALQSLDHETATAAFNLVRALAPTDARLANAGDRLAQLPALQASVAAASEHEQANELQQALRALATATEIDPSHQATVDAIDRVQVKVRRQNYMAAMSEGYAALEAGKYRTARTAFENAQKIEPGTSDARQALVQLGQSSTLASIARHQRTADERAAAGDWPGVITALEAALKLDPSLQFAQRGIATARTRVRLSEQLDATLAAPGNLAKDDAYAAAVQLYRDAAKFVRTAPDLTARVDALERLLETASEPVPVTLVSDNATEVRILRVGVLGAFARKQVSLRPGDYTVVGTRDGYRDTRQTIAITPNMAPVSITCREPI